MYSLTKGKNRRKFLEKAPLKETGNSSPGQWKEKGNLVIKGKDEAGPWGGYLLHGGKECGKASLSFNTIHQTTNPSKRKRTQLESVLCRSLRGRTTSTIHT